MKDYKIEACPLMTFMTDNNYKLPRYQRKNTWSKPQNFGLCVSVFQGYPIGVCIVNSTNNNLFLLDGRQRRNCLTQLYENPVAVYDWASNFCKFKSSFSDQEVSQCFRNAVKAYLGKDYEENDFKDDEGYNGDSLSESNSDELDSQYDMQKLLDLILMVHQKKTKYKNSWFDAFDFTKYFFQKSIPYYGVLPGESGNNKGILAPELCRFIRDSAKYVKTPIGDYSKELFLQYINDKWSYLGEQVDPKMESKSRKGFLEHLEVHWNKIKASYKAIEDCDNVMKKARVGMIQLNNAKTLDAQNIFSKINSGGTQLTAAELLSAKPYWNKKVSLKKDAAEKVSLLYHKLELDVPVNDYVRWDIPATLVSRIDEKHLFFVSNNSNPDMDPVDVKEIATGFKILSACSEKVKGMSKISLDKLEEDDNVDWSDNLETMISDLKIVISIISDLPAFKILSMWDICINDMLGNAPTLEFLALSYFNWIAKGRPGSASTLGKKFLSEVKNHFDRLVFEKATGKWKGSGDSKMAHNIESEEMAKRYAEISDVEKSAWSVFIEGAVKGIVDNQETTIDSMKPLLYYAHMIEGFVPMGGYSKFEIDHIFPKSKFESNKNIPVHYMESLTNLAILPSSINEAKKDRPLEKTDNSIQPVISKYEKIDIENFNKFSDITNFESLILNRGESFKTIFLEERISYLSN